jgi:hypothetical protein
LQSETGLPDGIFYIKPKILIWVNFGWGNNGRCWYILWPFGQFYGHLVNFMAIWLILWSFVKLYGYFVYFYRFGYCTKKNSDLKNNEEIQRPVVRNLTPWEI